MEQIFIDNPAAGYYSLQISHKGNIGAGQDFSLIISGMEITTTNTWTGDFNSYWHNDGNWTLGHIPFPDEVVIITSDGYHPAVIDFYNEECDTLIIEAGAGLIIRDQMLEVNGDITIHGELDMDNTAADLYAYNDIFWESGSSCSMTGSATIYVYGTWEFMDGANVYLSGGFVDFQGGSASYIRSKDENSYFYRIRNYKSGSELGHSAQSNQPLNIHGNLYNYAGCELTSYTSHPIVITGFINNMSGSIHLGNGTVKYDGVGSTSNFMAGDYFHNLTISSSGTTTFDDALEIKYDVLIESGSLDPDDNTLTVGGNWTNNVGAGGFIEGTGRVIFNGLVGHQYCSNETFNILEIDKPAAAFRLNGTTVTCTSYDWTSGALDVLSGTFTANDLADDGLYGNFYTNPGGTLNLHQDSGHGSIWKEV